MSTIGSRFPELKHLLRLWGTRDKAVPLRANMSERVPELCPGENIDIKVNTVVHLRKQLEQVAEVRQFVQHPSR